MNYEKYMSVTDFKNMIRSISPDQRAEILSMYLKDRIVFNNDTLYVIDSNIIYQSMSKTETYMLSTVTNFILQSWNKINETDRVDIKEIKGYNKVFENAYVKSYLPQLTTRLTNDKIKMDLYFKQIHFKNGYINLETGKFYKRVLGKHFITKSISYNYKPSKKEVRNELLHEISKIYPKQNVLHTILTILGSALTGLATKDAYLMFLIGKSSAGKSTILDLAKYATEIYVKQIKPDTFTEGKNTDKIVNTYENAVYIRITWLNEPKDRKFDNAFIKSWADGECNAEKLYKEGSHDFKHFSLTIFTANNMPNIQVSEGVQRRIRAYEHTSKFVEDDELVDEELNIYLADTEFKINFQHSEDSKLALVDILVEYAKKWLENKKIVLPDEFKETANEILESNDVIQDFIDGYIVKTDLEAERIGKNVMLKMFSEAYPNKHLTEMQLTSELKTRGLKYNRQLRSDGVQGSFLGVKVKDQSLFNKHDKAPTNNNDDEKIEMSDKIDNQRDIIKYLISVLNKHNITPDEQYLMEYKELIQTKVEVEKAPTKKVMVKPNECMLNTQKVKHTEKAKKVINMEDYPIEGDDILKFL